MVKLRLPSGEIVYDGAVLKTPDNTSYILHFGKYTCNNYTINGWYLQAVGQMSRIPISDEILGTCVVVNNGSHIDMGRPPSHGHGSGCCCPPIDPLPPPIRPDKEIFTSQDKYYLDRSWISVDTIVERDSIPLGIVINGRIVGVNNPGDGYGPKYYRYNPKTLQWDEIVYRNEEYEDSISDIEIRIKLLTDAFKSYRDSNDLDKKSIQDELETIYKSIEDVTSTQDIHKQDILNIQESIRILEEQVESIDLDTEGILKKLEDIQNNIENILFEPYSEQEIDELLGVN